MVGVGVDDPVIALAGARVVDLGVVDHVVGAERTHEIHLFGAADAGHLRPHRLRDLDGERAHVARRAVDQDLVAWFRGPAIAQPQTLEREDRRMRKGGGFLEGHAGRHRLERLLRCADVFGESALPKREQVGEDLVARPESRHARSDGLDDAGDIDSDAMVPRRTEAHEQAGERRPGRETVEIGPVDGRRAHADEHLVVRGNGTIDLREVNDVGRAVSVPDSRLHATTVPPDSSMIREIPTRMSAEDSAITTRSGPVSTRR